MEYYSAIAGGYNELYREEQLRKLRKIKELVTRRGLLLDVGAGTCLAREVFTDHAVVSLDPSENMLREGDGKRVVGSAEELPFKDGLFDVVIAVTSLHHWFLPRAIAEVERVAKSGGQVVVSMLKKAKWDSALFGEYDRVDGEKDVIFVRVK